MTVSTHAAFTPDEVISLVRSGACELRLLSSATPVRPAAPDVLHVEDQPFVVVAAPGGTIEDDVAVRPEDLAGQKLIPSRTRQPDAPERRRHHRGGPGTGTEIVTVVDHRTSILPLVLAGVGVAVLPSSWTRLARRCGAVVAPIEPTAHLHVAMVGSSPTSVINAAAATTRRIKLGTRATVLSTDDPIRVFQQLATAASLDPGRVELVAGRGSSTITFPLFDHEHDYDRLYASKLDLLMAVNAGENVTWHRPHRQRPLASARRCFRRSVPNWRNREPEQPPRPSRRSAMPAPASQLAAGAVPGRDGARTQRTADVIADPRGRTHHSSTTGRRGRRSSRAAQEGRSETALAARTP